MLTETEAFRKLLYHSCSNPAYYPDDGVTQEYRIELHCETMIVRAQRDGDGYKVLSVEPAQN